MKLTKKQKKFVKNNYKNLSVKQISKKLGIKRRSVEKYLSDLGKKPKPPKKQLTSNRKPYVSLKSWADLVNFWKEHIDFIAIATIIILAVYANSLNGDFVSDDIAGYLENPVTQNFWLSIKSLNIHRIIHAINWQIFGTNPLGSHLASVIFHVLSAILAFTAMANLFNKKISMLGTLLFMLHPVNVESISWISGRGHVIMGFFTFLSFTFYAIYKNSKNKKYLWFSFIVFFISLGSIRSPKVLAFIPMLVILDQFFYEKRIKLKKLIKFWPLVLASAVFLLLITANITGRIQSVGTTSPAPTNSPYPVRLSYSLYKTTELLFYPKKLSLYHEGEVVTPFMQVLMYTNLVALVGLIIYFWKKNRTIAGLILLILSSIFYMLSPYQVSWFIADRYLYLATFSFGIILAYTFTKIEKRSNIKNLALILTVILSIVYSVRIIIRNKDWSSRRALWESTARVYPRSPRSYNNLGDVYVKAGEYQKSVEAFEKSIELNPNYPDPIHNLGITYFKMGKNEKAKEQFKKALEMNPNLYQSYFQLGVVEFSEKNYQQATLYMNKVLEINPNYVPAISAIETIKQAAQ